MDAMAFVDLDQVSRPQPRLVPCYPRHMTRVLADCRTDWIGGNVWHGARIGAWLYRVGSELNSSAVLVDSWDRHCDTMKDTPLEAFWGIGNAFLQRTPTAGPVSPIVRPPSPSYLPSPATISPTSPIMSDMAPWDSRRHEPMSWNDQCCSASRQWKQPLYWS